MQKKQWVEKYRPTKFEEIKGQNLPLEKIKIFVNQFARSKKKAILLYGPPGTGKTTIAHVVAKETNSEIFELNASDLRNKGKLNEILKPAIEQKSLLKNKKIILVDEVDGISAADRGGLTELLTIMSKTTYPIIITANKVWDKKISNLRKKCELLPIKELDYKIIKEVLKEILTKENKVLRDNILTKIAIKSKGDIRASINDLQTATNVENPEEILFDERNKQTNIFDALKIIFKTRPTNETLRVFNEIDMPLDEIILWIEENIPSEYSRQDLAKAYIALANADLFKGRIYKQQYWRFLVYENIFLSFGICAAKSEIKQSYSTYKKPGRILKIWINNLRIAKKKSIATKYAKLVHIGQKRALKEYSIIKQIIKSNPAIQKELKLDREEISYVMR